MSAFVLDASIALKWFLEDESDRSLSLAILATITAEYRPVVPLLWYYEISSALLVQVRRKRIQFQKAMTFLALINEMPIDIDPPISSAILRLAHLANTHNLTTYDTAYLELAQRLKVPLATSDRQLTRAASECRVEIFAVPTS